MRSAIQDEVIDHLTFLVEDMRGTADDEVAEAIDAATVLLLERTKFPDEALVFEDILCASFRFKVEVVDFSEYFSKIRCIYFNQQSGQTIHQTINDEYFLRNFRPCTKEAEVLAEMVAQSLRK